MLWNSTDLKGFTLGARDGEIGRVKEFYFDSEAWTVRYLVADTGKWLPSRQVLISPHAVRGIRLPDKVVDLDLTRQQIEESPSIDQDKPVSRQFELEYAQYYQYPAYWEGPAIWGPMPRPGDNYSQVTPPLKPVSERQRAAADPHLHSTRAVTGYYIHAKDGDIGHLEDFVIDDHDWVIQYLVVDTVNWWPGKKVLVSPAWASEVNWREWKIYLGVERATIKGAPEYDRSRPITRDYEQRLYSYYRLTPYWDERAAA